MSMETLAVDRPWLLLGDCLERMREIPDGSVDMIAADLPYKTTHHHWDLLIPFEPLWLEYKRVTKPNAAIVLTSSQPFTSALVMSNPKWFRYEWIWHKTVGSNPLLVSFQPFKKHENVCVFYGSKPTYNQQWEEGEPYSSKPRKSGLAAQGGAGGTTKAIENTGKRYPGSVQLFRNPNNGNVHPAQKPVALFEYLIRTYTNFGEVVLDNCFGSGTTGVACANTGRRFIGIERDPHYFDVGRKRIDTAIATASQPAPQGGLFDAQAAE